MTAPRTKKIVLFWRLLGALGLGVATSLTVSTWIAVQQHTEDLNQFNSAATSVLAAGHLIQTEITVNHGASYSVLVQLCHLTPGCVVPPPNTSTNTKGAP